MNILVTLTLWLVLLLHPWRLQTLTTRPPRPRPQQRRRPITRTTHLADGRLVTFDGWRSYHVVGIRFQIDAFYRRLPKAGGEV